MWEKEPVNKEKRKLKLDTLPFSFTCMLHKNYNLTDPSGFSRGRAYYGDILNRRVGFFFSARACKINQVDQDCVALTRQRVKELQKTLKEAISEMEVER